MRTTGILICLCLTAARGQFQREWQSGNLGTYAWGASYGYDIDDDGTPNMWTRDSGRIIVYRNYSPWWTINYGSYAYPMLVTPRDVDGDGLMKPVNMDADPAGEVVATAYRISGSDWYGRIRVYDASTRQLEWESAELPGFAGTASVDDVDGDGKHEVIITRYNYSSGWGYVEVYGHVGVGLDGHLQYEMEKSEPTASPSVATDAAWVRFGLQAGAQVRLQVFDRAGGLIRTLVDSRLPAGGYKVRWDGGDEAGRPVGAGSYVYRLDQGGTVCSGQLVIVR